MSQLQIIPMIEQYLFIESFNNQEKSIDSEQFKKRFNGLNLCDYIDASQDNQVIFTSKKILEWLSDNFKTANMQGVTRVFLFYSGHGQKRTGDWQIRENNDKQLIQFQSVMAQWSSHQISKKASLYLLLDSCYSGNWCHRLAISGYKNVSIFAGAGKHQKAKDIYGGLFFKTLFSNDNSLDQNLKNLFFYQSPIFISNSNECAPLKLSELTKVSKNFKQIGKLISTPPNEDIIQKLKDNDWLIIYKNGGKYHGNVKNNKPDEVGKMWFPNGEIYQGKFKEGEMDGKGKYYSGLFQYSGMFSNNKLNGVGEMKLLGQYNHINLNQMFPLVNFPQPKLSMQVQFKNNYRIK